MDPKSLRFLCPNGHLGFAPLKTESFNLGVRMKPDFILADSGSNDIGPGPLATDIATSPRDWQEHDLEHMLIASRKLGVPMIIGSAGDTGTQKQVDYFTAVIQRLAEKHDLADFSIGFFYSDVEKSYLQDMMSRGEIVQGLDNRPNLTMEQLQGTDRIVAMAGVHPYMKLLEMGADVIIGGRCSDCAIFAAPAILAGFPQSLSYYLGKVLECASFCAEPYGGKETVIGEISLEDVRVTAIHPAQRCTVASVAGHAMYERSNPFDEYVAGGKLDMSKCRYEQFDEKTTRITGPKFIPAQEFRVKLEGAAKVGERYIGFASIRDPYTIAHVDQVIGWAKDQVKEKFGSKGYELHYHVFGKNGVMGEMEPLKDTHSHELCLAVQGIAPTKKQAEEVAMIGTRQMFYARLPEVKGTAGGVAFFLDEVLPASPACRWTLNHTVRVSDPLELFPVKLIRART